MQLCLADKVTGKNSHSFSEGFLENSLFLLGWMYGVVTLTVFLGHVWVKFFTKTKDSLSPDKILNLCVTKPTIWVPTRSDTNWAVQSQKTARSLKFRI